MSESWLQGKVVEKSGLGNEVDRVCHLTPLHLSAFCFFLMFLGKPAGKHVIIVDDLVQTGGTLRECGKVSGQIDSCFLILFPDNCKGHIRVKHRSSTHK